jgi:hypothetical protein
LSETTTPERQAAGGQVGNGWTFPTLTAAIAIDVMNRLNVEKQET